MNGIWNAIPLGIAATLLAERTLATDRIDAWITTLNEEQSSAYIYQKNCKVCPEVEDDAGNINVTNCPIIVKEPTGDCDNAPQ